jgi:hypothetical protein
MEVSEHFNWVTEVAAAANGPDTALPSDTPSKEVNMSSVSTLQQYLQQALPQASCGT